MACSSGSERIIHGLRKCLYEHRMEDDFVVAKIDMQNAGFATHIPGLLPWLVWCYGSYSILWHLMGRISSQSEVQQGDPLGPLLFSLVLHKIASAVNSDEQCLTFFSRHGF